ncbi:hypothetical protein SARC_13785 [Sphaeroforma arctica JP610]|uniref:SGNH hydrolase-type esterase domain-containing protein n=1 Tax=Sphaeroforma arctica JP610 TaxID=667725 RepID=A0A0L0FAX9_9EUKA|nr:hypothetical protein SARC_13785 [Sphaeroforma arctica JP610]KNC73656.1 hypothetical protein SARC_13785 [Sphaeroforma arctica JP610]|eukprot:XP_014147558.1 hypothetical protein SARC_13785 [Sphaeroforma arctica JP610]
MRRAIAASEHTKDRNITLVNRGYNGATIQDLIRGGDAYGVISLPYVAGLKIDKPTVVVIFVGVNDVSLSGDYAEGHNCSDVNQYQQLLHGMVDTARELTDASVVLSTVSVYGEKPMYENYHDKNMNEFSKAVYMTSIEQQTGFADLRGAYFRYYKQYNSKHPVEAGVLTRSDSVHPSPQGQVLIANEMAKAICDALTYRDK